MRFDLHGSPRLDAFRRFALCCLAPLLFLAADAATATPQIQTWETTNGARVLFVAAPEIPMVDVRVVFAAGSARDGDRAGLASMTASMLDEGAGDWDANALADRLDFVGASLSAGVDRDMTSVSLRSLTRADALDVAVETMAAVLAKPTFDADALERVRQNRLVALRQQEESPQQIGRKALFHAVYQGHPYASDPAGTAESISALSRAELQAFHERYYVAANAVVAIVGDLDRAAAEALAERIISGLPKGEAAATLPQVSDLASGTLKTITFPSSQTTVMAGQPGTKRGDPDYFTLYVGNHILGGSGLVSILMDEIREKRGLSYSTYSYFMPLAEPGPFIMGLQTRNDQAEQARQVMLNTLERFIAEGPTEAELTAAKKNITGGFPLKIASNGDIVQYLAVIGFYGLPLDYLDRFPGRIESVTVEQIRDAFARRVHPNRLAIVTVGGDAKKVSQVSGAD
ncbi:insulinase family protein [Thiorhodococcus mannitoliphagus]|uniref:Insulinase family protein n=1 Tax=Thiorhodococcus mannitoliphagus TaxID=329406 RepID=A0A6P1DNZ2_9GAMM|nr:pitrilysin family protein [Thiorhodococcus mannitoliphagus]NEX19260.1 insulinase family protein [Thiorhodococcus mannitoliphagus]